MAATTAMAPAAQRAQMVTEQVAARGIRDPRVLSALGEIPREVFVPDAQKARAYQDRALGIGRGQTISQPYVVALMAEAAELRGGERVLEVGTGSGYGAALLSRLAGHVFTIERHEDLARTAQDHLGLIGIHNVRVLVGDGTLGWPDAAPFDAILVTAGGPQVPEALLAQMQVGGRLVIPVGPDPGAQRLLRVRRLSGTEYEQEDLGAVTFVPLIGAQGWGSSAAGDPPQRPVFKVLA